MRDVLTPEALRLIDETIELKAEALKILELIVSEWKSDPMSVQCFDLRMVERATYITKRLKELKNV